MGFSDHADSHHRPSRPSGPVVTPDWHDRQPAWAVRPFRRGKSAGPALESTEASRARLSFVLLVYFVAFVAVLQLAPFGFGAVADVRRVVITGWRDHVTGVLLFVPLGFLYPLTRQRDDASPTHVALWGGLIAALITVGRIFEVDREIALLDIVAGATGAAAGGALLRAINHRTRASARLSGRLSLEIPLIGLIYLLLPLSIATSLTAVDDVRRMLMLLPLAFLAARLLSGVQEHHFGPARVLTVRGMSLVAVGWTALGTFPAAFRHPLLVAGVIIVAGVATLYDASRPALHGEERRFEADILRSAAPYVIVYFLDVVFLPLAAGFDTWHFAFGLAGSGGDLTRQVVHLLEPVASIALLGYLLAEVRGRRELPFRRVAVRVAIECAMVALAIEASRGFQRQVGASALELALLIAASVLGAGMYHHQRERVQWMLIRRVSAPPPPKSGLSTFARLSA
jgi:hypothetical protein